MKKIKRYILMLIRHYNMFGYQGVNVGGALDAIAYILGIDLTISVLCGAWAGDPHLETIQRIGLSA